MSDQILFRGNGVFPSFSDATVLVNQKLPEQWIMSDLVSLGTELHLYGEEGSGKSRLALQLAHSIVTGKPFLGIFEILRTGPVLFLECDMDRPEMDAMLTDAKAHGLLDQPGIAIPHKRMELNAFLERDRQVLVDLNKAVKPMFVIVDTVNEAGISKNTNEETTEFIRIFRAAFPGCGLCYLNHEKKPGMTQTGEVAPRNKYSYLGGAWRRKTRSNMQLLVRGDNPVRGKLDLTKQRGKKKLTSLDLVQNQDTGFWETEMSVKLALATWPHCIPASNGRSYLGCRTVADVCQTIEDAFGYRKATVRQTFDRETKSRVVYSWVDGLPKEQDTIQEEVPF